MYLPHFVAGIDLEELVSEALISRRLTMGDRLKLMHAFLQDALSEADLVLVDRLLYGVRRGILHLTE